MTFYTRIPMFVHEDERGRLQETWSNQFTIKSTKVVTSPKAKTWRGLHYQLHHPQAKLITCVSGAMWGAVMDMREGSELAGVTNIYRLKAKDTDAIFIPKGFAHGYLTLMPDTTVIYHCDEHHFPSDERSVRIAYDEIIKDFIHSERDAKAPKFEDAERIVL